jgi:hypothetical protein
VLIATRPQGSDSSFQKLLIGTHTSNDEQNYIQIMNVKIPLESSKDSRDQVMEPVRDPNAQPAAPGTQPKNERITVNT